MKKIFLIVFILMPFCLNGQSKTNLLSLSYFGEMISHPGFRVGLEVPVTEWGDSNQNHVTIGPSIGLFCHKRYQTSYFFINDFTYRRAGKKGSFYSAGIGIGFQNSQVPNTYYPLKDGSAHKLNANHWYMLADLSFSLDKKMNFIKEKEVHVFIKPQLLIAYPNFPTSLGYFVFEVGIKHKINI
jgi:hypothetical protein